MTSSAFQGSTDNFIGQTLTFTSGADAGKTPDCQTLPPNDRNLSSFAIRSSPVPPPSGKPPRSAAPSRPGSSSLDGHMPLSQAGDAFTVTGTATYDGTAHPAIGTATGIGGVLPITSIGGTIAPASSTTQFTSSAFIGNRDHFIGDEVPIHFRADNGKSGIVQSFDLTTWNLHPCYFLFQCLPGRGHLHDQQPQLQRHHAHQRRHLHRHLGLPRPSAATTRTPRGRSLTVFQASVQILVTPDNPAHDGILNTATIAVAVGVGGVDLSSDVDLSGTTHTNPASTSIPGPSTKRAATTRMRRHGYGR